jgi:hypothetical protein
VSLELQAEHVDAKIQPTGVASFEQGRAPASANWEDLRTFLVACHQASVSIETMSKYLGLHGETIRSELLLGIEAWNAGQRRSNEAATGPHPIIAASRG